MKQLKYMGKDGSSDIMRKIDKSLLWIYKLLPFTYLGIYRKNFDDIKKESGKITVLDLGCGDGLATKSLGFTKSFKITGVDIFEPYLKLAREKGIYKKLIKKDVRTINLNQKYDMVIANHILEHLDKPDGKKFIERIEKIAKKRIIIACPIGNLPQGEYDENPFQLHKSRWTVKEMKKMGYRVQSQGLKILWGNENVVAKYGILSYSLFVLSAILSPVLYFFPERGTYMICIKDVKK